MRTVSRAASAVAAVVFAGPAVLVLPVGTASAHGAMDSPVSRSFVCYQEGPEQPVTDVCAAVVDEGGAQPLYDWMEVNIADAAGRHREIIPDGQLCSAGRAKYRGLDLARSDWPTTSMQAGAEFTFRYRATAPHQGGFEFYVTRDGYDPTEPLGWDDLEPEPFHVEPSPQLVGGYYLMDATLPDKQGRHLIYAIWQRTDSPEAFYSCSDVVFAGGSPDGGGSDGSNEDGQGGSGDSYDSNDSSAPEDCGPAGGPPAHEEGTGRADGYDDGGDTHRAGQSANGEGGQGADRRDHGYYRGWKALFDWLDRLREWARTSPRLADDAVLASSVVPAGRTAGDHGDQLPSVLVGMLALAFGVALVAVRPLRRGRHRRHPAHRC